MKKLLMILALFAFLGSGTVFAKNNSDDSEETEKFMGGSAGLRLSVLGLTVEGSFILTKAEFRLFTPLITGESFATKEKTFGMGFGTSVGYLDKAWQRGWSNGIGFSYLFLPSSYITTTLLGNAIDSAKELAKDKDKADYDYSVHVVALYYRGTKKFGDVFGLSLNFQLPLFIGANNGDYMLSIIDSTTGWLCWLMAPCSIGVGLRFEF